MTKKRYFDNPMESEFTAEVIETLRDGRGFGVILSETGFHPTSGGQAHDTGVLGDSRVVDVLIDDENRIIHYLDNEIKTGTYPAKIDWEHRFANMQHHTGQHILSAAFWQEMELETLSSHISGETPSTIDFDVEILTPEQIARVEDAANAIVFENRTVKTYFVSDKSEVSFRRPPKVEGEIRVVEIEGFDYSACGGTHCPQTGMVGMLKVVRTERVNQKLRVHFVAGKQALAYFDSLQDAAMQTAALLDVGAAEMAESVMRLQQQLKAAERELKSLREMKLDVEAKKMVQLAEPIEEKWLATALFENRDPGELRSLAMKLRAYPGMVAVLASFDGKKLSLVAACAEDTALDASQLLQDHLAPFNGRGGGDQSIAQGGCAAEEISELFLYTKEMVRNS